MIGIRKTGAYYRGGRWLDKDAAPAAHQVSEPLCIARRILRAHDRDAGTGSLMRISFDALASHDITYVGIVQTARASGMNSFPVPYTLTNCHNSLCAVGGTINEDDHLFGLSAAKKYGGDYVPAHLAVIHQYMREMHAGCGKMILGSDSHTRYGALGTLGIGEGGPELVKQLLGRTYDLKEPEVVAVYLEGSPRPGVGPQDVALALIRAVFRDGLVKNRILEFVGPGIDKLSVDYRLGIDVMTTESTCLSSIWRTDAKVRAWLAAHGRERDFAALEPDEGAWYDAVISLDLGAVEPMIALPFHPSNAFTIREFLANAEELLAGVEKAAAAQLGAPTGPVLRSKLRGGEFYVDQGIVAGCAGGIYENLARVAAVLDGKSSGSGAFSLAVYPASQPQFLELVKSGLAGTLLKAGATIKTAFCGPCFGAGDIPANNAFSIRHTTRNFPNREGSKPSDGQMAYVALMDARSIAATAANHGRLTPADELPEPLEESFVPYSFDRGVYDKRVYYGSGVFGSGGPEKGSELVFGPNIADWPVMPAMPENLLLGVVSAIYDEVTTTDELIPSGETSSYRSNPRKLAEFTLQRKDPQYVGRAKRWQALETARRLLVAGQSGEAADPDGPKPGDARSLFADLGLEKEIEHTGVGSLIFAMKPGDGSAREQAASCQKVLGGWANIAREYATKRYRANLVNWGLLPLVLGEQALQDLLDAPPAKDLLGTVLGQCNPVLQGDVLFLPGIRQALISGREEISALLFRRGAKKEFTLRLPAIGDEERQILLAGCLINHYAGSGHHAG